MALLPSFAGGGERGRPDPLGNPSLTDCSSVEIRKLTPEEAARAFPGDGAFSPADYDDLAAALRPGETLEADCGAASTRLFKRRLNAAARAHGLRLRYARRQDGTYVRLQVLAQR